MNIKKITFAVVAFFLSNICIAQNYNSEKVDSEVKDFQWPEGIRMAISLTFDDARYSQIDQGVPLLDRYNVKGTFYVSPDNLIERIDAWKNAVHNGHDIGNHSVRHSCSVNFEWTRDHALEDYTLSQMDEELDSASRIIENLLGIQPVSFAYPCGQTYIGEGVDTKSYIPLVAAKFQTGRTWMDEAPNDPVFCNIHQLTGIKLDGRDFKEIKPIIESARRSGQWLILAGHETKKKGDSDALVSSLSTIEKICRYAKNPANGIWIDNVHNIASYVEEQRIRQED